MMADERPDSPKSSPTRMGFTSDHRDSWTIEPMPEGLEDSPLDFLFADHHRQRQAVQMLLEIAGGKYDETGVRNLIVFFEKDFALHILDEECDFVPLLRQHCPPDDGIDGLVERLSREHADDKSSVKGIISILQNLLQGNRMSQQEEADIRAFALHLRQHLAIENGVLLPIARVRLRADSLDELSQAIRNRRAQQG